LIWPPAIAPASCISRSVDMSPTVVAPHRRHGFLH
jgi:hypothetical protein